MEDITDSFISTIIKNSQLFENPLQRSGLNTDLIDYPWLTFEDVVDFSTEVPPGGTVGLPYLFPLFSLLMAWKVQKVSKSILFFLIYTRSEDLQGKLFSPPCRFLFLLWNIALCATPVWWEPRARRSHLQLLAVPGLKDEPGFFQQQMAALPCLSFVHTTHLSVLLSGGEVINPLYTPLYRGIGPPALCADHRKSTPRDPFIDGLSV